MKIIIRYAFREVLAPFLLALVAFTSLLVVDKVFDLTKYFVEKGIKPTSQLGELPILPRPEAIHPIRRRGNEENDDEFR